MKGKEIIYIALMAFFTLNCRSKPLEMAQQKNFVYNYSPIYEGQGESIMLVLRYANSLKYDDTGKCYSECFGMDTLTHYIFKIYSLCDSSDHFEMGQLVRFTPLKYNGDHSKYSDFIRAKYNKETLVSPLYSLRCYSIYGKIERLDSN